MTIPPHVIEVGARALIEVLDEPPWDHQSPHKKRELRNKAERCISAALAALWQPIESAEPKAGDKAYGWSAIEGEPYHMFFDDGRDSDGN